MEREVGGPLWGSSEYTFMMGSAGNNSNPFPYHPGSKQVIQFPRLPSIKRYLLIIHHLHHLYHLHPLHLLHPLHHLLLSYVLGASLNPF